MIRGVPRWSRQEPVLSAEAALQAPQDQPALFGALAAFAALICTLVWVVVGGSFWPVWVWLGLATAVALAVWVQRVRGGRATALGLHAELLAIAVAHCVAIWLIDGAASPFWPAWVMLGALSSVGLHAILRVRDQLPGAERERVLAARVSNLEVTRRGALDVQAAELRRIERDLHDGAQARLLALTMRLGRAEARLDGDPDTAALVRAAREDANAAIAELRDLARGIAPPVLADRGLVAAIQSLGERAPLPVRVTGSLARRPAPVVETAAYFVASEALTNVAKHAPRAAARVEVSEAAGELRLVVADDGPGGAVETGSGLTGLRQRVAALDGSFTVTSPAGAGTRLEVALPCGS